MSSQQRVVVYLGASQPVHVTHMRLVRALLDEGHDRVFVFLLRWRPERFGTSADAATGQLRRWLATLPAEDVARLDLQVVQHDHEAGPRMRAALGAGANPEVEVCFSQKYSGETERINRDWLPIYTSEFPQAKPRFLTDEIDPGAAACGTAKFVEALKRYKDAQGTPEVAATTAEFDKWRPVQESSAGWTTYIDGLFQGAHGEPFYVAEEKGQLEEAFFLIRRRCGCLIARGGIRSCPAVLINSSRTRKTGASFGKSTR
mmetsp:Transcript_122938/g.393848  ORF Transcript_122938/g.393848 Transcript_122938/m.393848 type:complete len:259 (+) Transcript_122938:66-842(+)